MTLHAALAGLLGARLGSMLFFAAIVAPTVFRALPGDAAGPFLRRVRSQISVISRLGSTSVETRTSSPFASSCWMKSLRSA